MKIYTLRIQAEDHNQPVSFFAMFEEQNVLPQPKKQKTEKSLNELKFVWVYAFSEINELIWCYFSFALRSNMA